MSPMLYPLRHMLHTVTVKPSDSQYITIQNYLYKLKLSTFTHFQDIHINKLL